MNKTQRRARRVRETFRKAVADDLDKKRRLGQYAVVFQNGKVVRIDPEQISQLTRSSYENMQKPA